MFNYDVLIIGSGPAGAICASGIRNKSVAIIEKDEQYDKLCGGAVSKLMLDRHSVEMPPIRKKAIMGARVCGPDDRCVEIDANDMGYDVGGYIFERGDLDREIAKDAEKNADLVYDDVVKVEKDNGCFTVECKSGDRYSCRFLIDATGATAKISKKFGVVSDLKPRDYRVVLQADIDSDTSDPYLSVYLDNNYAPHSYAWVFPALDTVKVGLGVPGGYQPSRYLDKFIEDKGIKGEEIRRRGKVLALAPPVSKLVKPVNGCYVMAVGDAGRMCDPLSVDAYEPVCIRDSSGNIRVIPIKDVESTDAKDVACVDPDTLKMCFRRINYVIKHKITEPLLQIDLETGRSVKVTSSHSVFSVRDGKIYPTKASDLSVGDYLITPMQIPTEPTQYIPTELVRIMGYYLAEGDIRKGDNKKPWHIRLTFGNSTSKETINDAIECAEALNLKSAVYSYKWKRIVRIYATRDDPRSMPRVDREKARSLVNDGYSYTKIGKMLGYSCNTVSKHVNSSDPPPEKVNLLNMEWPEYSISKKVPDIIFNIPKEKKIEFLNAYFLGDGGYSNDELKFHTSSPKLASDLCYLLYTVGVPAIVRHNSRNRHATIGHRKITRQPITYDVIISGHDRIRQCKGIWKGYPKRKKIDDYLSRGRNRELLTTVPLKKEQRKKHRKKHSGRDYIFRYIDDPDIERLGNSDLLFLRVKNIKRVKSTNGMVYDISTEGAENFVAGFGGVICHNTGGGIINSIVSGREAARAINDGDPLMYDKYVSNVKRQNMGRHLFREAMPMSNTSYKILSGSDFIVNGILSRIAKMF